MKNGKYTRKSSGMKVTSVLLAALLLVGCSVGATLAWMTAKTEEVKNTFTVGNIQIDLKEHQYVPETNTLKKGANDPLVTKNDNYKIVPGMTAPKDPFVTVKANSEKCWLFVRIDEANNADIGAQQMVKYDQNEKFKDVAPEAYHKVGIYIYCYEVPVEMSTEDQTFYVIGENQVTFNSSITNSDISAIIGDPTKNPVLQFTAAAIQYDGFEYTATEDPEGTIWEDTVKKALDALGGDFLEAKNKVTGEAVTPPTT